MVIFPHPIEMQNFSAVMQGKNMDMPPYDDYL